MHLWSPFELTTAALAFHQQSQALLQPTIAPQKPARHLRAITPTGVRRFFLHISVAHFAPPRTQAGTDSSDWITAATASQAVAGAPRAILAGTTEGSWDGDNNGEEDFVLVSLDVGEVDPIPTPAPFQSPSSVPSTPAPSQSPLSVPSTPAPQLTIRAPETTPAPFTRAPFVLLPPEEGLPTTTTPAPSSASSGPLQGQTLAPTSPPQESDPDLANVVGVVAMVVVGVSLFAGCVGCVLGCVTGKDKKKKKNDDGGGGGRSSGGRSSGGGERSGGGGSQSSPSFLARCRRNRYVFMCSKLFQSGMALMSPLDVGSDLFVICGYWMDSHPLWTTLLVVLFVLSCRFTVAFAALHPPPDKNVILPLYVFPFGTASYHSLAEEPENTPRSARATKKDGEEAEKCLGSFLPIWLRSLFTVGKESLLFFGRRPGVRNGWVKTRCYFFVWEAPHGVRNGLFPH